MNIRQSAKFQCNVSQATRFARQTFLLVWLTTCTIANAGTIIINDKFDDGNLATNSKGPGDGWNLGVNKIESALEENGTAFVSIGIEHGSCRLQGKEADDFKFWNDSGVTVTWVISETEINTIHYKDMYTPFHWNLGVISAQADHAGYNHIGASTFGAFYLDIAWRDKDHVRVALEITNKNTTGEEGVKTGRAKLGNSLITKPVYPIVVTAKLNKNEWLVSINQKMSGSMPLSGNWSSDLSEGELDGAITNEFEGGAFIMTMGRNSGIIDNKSHFTPNSSKIEEIKVETNEDHCMQQSY